MGHPDRTPIIERYSDSAQLLASGGVNDIFVTSDDVHSYIVRFPRHELTAKGDFLGCQRNYIASVQFLAREGLEILPQIVEHDTTGMVMLRTPGDHLITIASALATEEKTLELARLAKDTADLLLRLHTLRIPQWGAFVQRDDEQLGNPKSNYEYIMAWLDRQTPYIREEGLLQPEALDEAIRLITDGKDLIERQYEPRFIHNDFTPLNILINPDNLAITALIDFDRSGGGDPLIDFAYLLITNEYRQLPLAFRRVFEKQYVDGRMREGDTMERFGLIQLFVCLQYLPIAHNGGGWDGVEERIQQQIYEAITTPEPGKKRAAEADG